MSVCVARGHVAKWTPILAFTAGIVILAIILTAFALIQTRSLKQVDSPGVACYVEEVQTVLEQIIATNVWGRLEGVSSDNMTIKDVRVHYVSEYSDSVKMECKVLVEGVSRPYVLHVIYDADANKPDKLAFGPYPSKGVGRKAMERARKLAASDPDEFRKMLSDMPESTSGQTRGHSWQEWVLNDLFARPSSGFVEVYYSRHGVYGIGINVEVFPRDDPDTTFLVSFDSYGNLIEVMMFSS